ELLQCGGELGVGRRPFRGSTGGGTRGRCQRRAVQLPPTLRMACRSIQRGAVRLAFENREYSGGRAAPRPTEDRPRLRRQSGTLGDVLTVGQSRHRPRARKGACHNVKWSSTYRRYLALRHEEDFEAALEEAPEEISGFL